MLTASELVDEVLAHDGTYDPVKAHEYYLKKRQLKGRKAGSSDESSGSRSSSSRPSGKPAVSAAQRASARSAKTQARVDAIGVKLDKMRAHLKDLIAKRAAKGTDTKKKAEPAGKDKGSASEAKSSDKKDTPKLTASEKAEKARKARAKYEKVKKDPSDMTSAELDAEITKVRERIRQLKSQLDTVKSQARSRVSA